MIWVIHLGHLSKNTLLTCYTISPVPCFCFLCQWSYIIENSSLHFSDVRIWRAETPGSVFSDLHNLQRDFGGISESNVQDGDLKFQFCPNLPSNIRQASLISYLDLHLPTVTFIRPARAKVQKCFMTSNSKKILWRAYENRAFRTQPRVSEPRVLRLHF